jgi:hypothetical protein
MLPHARLAERGEPVLRMLTYAEVRMLTHARFAERGALVFNDGIWNSLTGTQFTCFTGTKVQMLTPEEWRALLFNDGIWNCRTGVSIGTFVRCQYLYFVLVKQVN